MKTSSGKVRQSQRKWKACGCADWRGEGAWTGGGSSTGGSTQCVRGPQQARRSSLPMTSHMNPAHTGPSKAPGKLPLSIIPSPPHRQQHTPAPQHTTRHTQQATRNTANKNHAPPLQTTLPMHPPDREDNGGITDPWFIRSTVTNQASKQVTAHRQSPAHPVTHHAARKPADCPQQARSAQNQAITP